MVTESTGSGSQPVIGIIGMGDVSDPIVASGLVKIVWRRTQIAR
jgi:hypothetical protein